MLGALSLIACNCAPRQSHEAEYTHSLEKWLPKRTELGVAGSFRIFQEAAEGDSFDATYYVVAGEKSLAVYDESAMAQEGPRLGSLYIVGAEALKVEPVRVMPQYAASVTTGAPPLERSQIPQDMAIAAESIISLANEVLAEEEALGSLLPESAMELIRAAAQGTFILSSDSPFVAVRRSRIYFRNREVVRLYIGSLGQEVVSLDLYLWDGRFALIYRGRRLAPELRIVSEPGLLEATPAKRTDVKELKQGVMRRICDVLDYVVDAGSSGVVKLNADEREKVAGVSSFLKQEQAVKWRRPVHWDQLESIEEIEKLWL